MRVVLAFRAFFRVLFSAAAASRVQYALLPPEPQTAPPEKAEKAAPEKKEKKAPRPAKPARSEAITLLAALQREARLVDFLKEPLDGFSDAQVGTAARDVHRDSAAVLERLLAIRPLLDQQEGAQVEVPADFDPGQYRLAGNVGSTPPFSGKLAHHGWAATRCDLPEWKGSDEAARVVAPAEVDV